MRSGAMAEFKNCEHTGGLITAHRTTSKPTSLNLASLKYFPTLPYQSKKQQIIKTIMLLRLNTLLIIIQAAN